MSVSCHSPPSLFPPLPPGVPDDQERLFLAGKIGGRLFAEKMSEVTPTNLPLPATLYPLPPTPNPPPLFTLLLPFRLIVGV